MNNRSFCRNLVLLAGLVSGLTVLMGANPAHGVDDGFRIIDGKPKILSVSEGMERGRGPASLDANNGFVRFGGDGARMTLELECSPQEQNYLTVKVWGNSGSGGSRLLLKNSRGSGKLLHQRKAEPFPDRFYYATYPIPQKKTNGNSRVSVTLTHKGSGTGPELYGAYTHLGGYFEPPENDLQGEPFKLGPPRPEKEEGVSQKELYEHWKKEAQEAA